ncbi:MAG: ParB/RepB/Spo0J family partition protein [Cyanobacteria bacterium P01_D01_bin.56]
MSKTKATGFDIAGDEVVIEKYGSGSSTVEPEEVEKILTTPSNNLPTQNIEIADIERWDKQPRKYFNPKALELLVESFRKDGFLGTLLVRPNPNNSGYLIVFGERRWRAAKDAGLTEVPCVVRALDDSQALNLAMGENMLREDLSKLEETLGVLSVIESELGLNQDTVTKLINSHVKSRNMDKGSYVGTHKEAQEKLPKIQKILERYGISLSSFKSKSLQVLNLSEVLKKAHLEDNLDYSKALELNKLPDKEHVKALSVIYDDNNRDLSSLSEIKAYVKNRLTEIKAVPDRLDERTQFRAITKQIGSAQQWKKLTADTVKSRKLKRLLSQLESLLRE